MNCSTDESKSCLLAKKRKIKLVDVSQYTCYFANVPISCVFLEQRTTQPTNILRKCKTSIRFDLSQISRVLT